MIHMKTAFFFGIIGASPYILYLLYKFISPALYERTALCRESRRRRICDIHHRIAGKLFSDIPAHIGFLGTYQVSSDVQKFAFPSIIHGHAADDESRVRCGVRDTCHQLAACHVRTSQSRMDATLPPPCYRGDTHCGAQSSRQQQYFHLDYRIASDLVAIRNKYLDCENDKRSK